MEVDPHSEDDCEGAPGEERKLRRKARNRVSAAASRARKKQWVDALQDEVAQLTSQLECAQRARDALRHEATALRERLGVQAGSSGVGDADACLCAQQAGAAASLLAFQAVSPGAPERPMTDAIATDVELGKALRRHGLTGMVSIVTSAEALAAAATAAAPPAAAGGGAPLSAAKPGASPSASTVLTQSVSPLLLPVSAEDEVASPAICASDSDNASIATSRVPSFGATATPTLAAGHDAAAPTAPRAADLGTPMAPGARLAPSAADATDADSDVVKRLGGELGPAPKRIRDEATQAAEPSDVLQAPPLHRPPLLAHPRHTAGLTILAPPVQALHSLSNHNNNALEPRTASVSV